MTVIQKTKPLMVIVEDDPVYVGQIVSVFENRYDLRVFTLGLEALNYLNENVDLVLLDIHLPDINGLKLLEKINVLPELADLPVIFLTGENDLGVEEQGIRLGARDFITKPFSQAILRARVRNQIDLKEKNDALKRMATHDVLTGLLNRRAFNEIIEAEFARSRRENNSLSLIIFDIDCFKYVNDTYGHQIGDDVLVKVAEIASNLLKRPGDSIARYGGEEFAILLADTNAEGAALVAEELRRKIEETQVAQHLSHRVYVTSSFGLSSTKCSGVSSTLEMIKIADDCLYAAKNQGRNKVVSPK